MSDINNRNKSEEGDDQTAGENEVSSCFRKLSNASLNMEYYNKMNSQDPEEGKLIASKFERRRMSFLHVDEDAAPMRRRSSLIMNNPKKVKPQVTQTIHLKFSYLSVLNIIAAFSRGSWDTGLLLHWCHSRLVVLWCSISECHSNL